MNTHVHSDRGCTTVLELADRHVSGELPRDMARTIDEHLAACASCRQHIGGLRRVKDRLKSAVESEAATDALRDAVRNAVRGARGGRANILKLGTWPRWYFAAAAAVVLVIGGWGLYSLALRDHPQPTFAGRPGQGTTATPVSDRTTGLLRVGLNDHVVCAVKYKHSDERMTAEQMTAAMGPRYGQLLPAVRRHTAGFEVMVAHVCTIDGRPFVHMILRKGQQVTSLAFTRKKNEAFPAEPAARAVQGIPLFQARIQDLRAFDVTGFETRDYLAFVVSEAGDAENMRIAAALAPDVHAVLDGIPA